MHTPLTRFRQLAWPAIMTGEDFVGIAGAGSGKALALLAPLITLSKVKVRTCAEPELGGPFALVIAPTRALCERLRMASDKLADLQGVRTACIHGGAKVFFAF